MPGTSAGARRWIIPIVILGGLAAGAALAARGEAPPRSATRPPGRQARGPRGQSLTLTAGLGTWYDSNLLQYSDHQIAQFEDNIPTPPLPNQFSIHSIDDVTFSPSVALTWENDLGNGRRHDLRLRGGGEFHRENPTADFHATSLLWTETYPGERRFHVRGYYLPSYYLRQLKDVVTGAYERAQFSLSIAEVAGSQALSNGLRFGASYQYERRVYTPHFPERTSGTSQLAVSLGHDRLPARGGLEVLGGYRVSVADGRDYPGGATSPYPDVSYHGGWVGLGGHAEFSRSRTLRTGADLAYRFERRDYDSERPATDKTHFGRQDSNNVIEGGLHAQLHRRWTLRAFDRYDTNHAVYGAPAPPTTDPGSYHQNLVGLEITWSGAVWKQVPSAPTPED